MRRGLCVGAALIVLAANGWSVWQAVRNRSEARGGTLELTERELPLAGMPVESSVTVVRLNWKTDRGEAERQRSPVWLDTNKLTELGFDCGLPLNKPEARRHYSSQPLRRVFLAMEYQGEAPGQAEKPGRANTGLVVVDAAPDARRLRERYPNPQQHVIARGLVGLRMQRHDRDGTASNSLVLEGWVGALCPAELSAPRPANGLLLALRQSGAADSNKAAAAPRFSARVRWGANYEPWVDGIRPLTR